MAAFTSERIFSSGNGNRNFLGVKSKVEPPQQVGKVDVDASKAALVGMPDKNLARFIIKL